MKVYLIHGFAEAFDKLIGAITYLRDHYDIVAYEREYPIEETDTIMDTLTMIGGKGQTEWTFRAIDGERYTIVERVVQQEPYMGEKPNTGYNTCVEFIHNNREIESFTAFHFDDDTRRYMHSSHQSIGQETIHNTLVWAFRSDDGDLIDKNVSVDVMTMKHNIILLKNGVRQNKMKAKYDSDCHILYTVDGSLTIEPIPRAEEWCVKNAKRQVLTQGLLPDIQVRYNLVFERDISDHYNRDNFRVI
jgi:hypothetical protein